MRGDNRTALMRHLMRIIRTTRASTANIQYFDIAIELRPTKENIGVSSTYFRLKSVFQLNTPCKPSELV